MCLPLAEFAYNNTLHEAHTQQISFNANYGYYLKFDIFAIPWGENPVTKDFASHLVQL